VATAYTPGLKVSEKMLFRKERRLPLKGKVLVEMGEQVPADKDVAYSELPGDVISINVANRIGVQPADLPGVMLAETGEKVEKGQKIAEKKSFFGLFKSVTLAPEDGSIERVSNITGQVLFRKPPHPVRMNAFIDGTVVNVMPEEGVVIEATATFIQGIFGIGGEEVAPLRFAVDSPAKILEADDIKPDFKDCIIVGGAMATYASIQKAIEVGARGIITGGFNDKDLKEFLGYDLGVAITGSEEKGLSLIVTEGFGEIEMADKTFRILKEREGMKTSINGATQIRAGVIRPEIVIPLEQTDDRKTVDTPDEAGILNIGSNVRIIREPYFGRIGKVIDLPAPLQVMESETRVRTLDVEFDDGVKWSLPRANVELIEE